MPFASLPLWNYLVFAFLFFAVAFAVPSALAKSCTVDQAPLNSAQTAELREETSVALRLYRDLVAREPAELKWQTRAIKLQLDQNKVDAAWLEAQAMLSAHSQDPEAFLAVSLVSLRRGDFEFAMSSIQRALAVDPCNARVLAQLGYLQSLQGHRILANRTLDVAHRLAPNDIVVQLTWVYRLRGKAERAAFESVASTLPSLTEDQKRQFTWDTQVASVEASSTCTVIPTPSTVVVPFYSLDANHISPTEVPGLSVKINGHPEELELGAFADNPISLTKAAAQSLGLKRDTETWLPAHGGAARYMAHIDRLEIGGLEYRNCPAIVADENMDVHFHGAISVAFFKDFAVTVDLAKRRLSLDTLPQLESRGNNGDSEWSSARMGGPEVPSIIAGEWAANEPGIPSEKRDWMHAYDGGGNILVPVALGPSTERLFLLNYMRFPTFVLPSTAREASPIANDPSLSAREKTALRGARYSLRTGEVILPIDNWKERLDLPTAGSLGDEMGQMRVTIDFRDTLVKIQHSVR